MQLDSQAKKRALVDKLQGVTWQFVGTASQFQSLAQQVTGGIGKVTEFQTAARAFSDAGKKFKIVGEVLYELVQNANCAKLQGKATEFTKAAGSGSGRFHYKAYQISAVTAGTGASANVKAAIQAFNDAICTFKISANAFNEFAQAISTNCPNLVAKAELFKDTCDLFAADASTFNKRAQLIASTGANLGNGTATAFQGAADKFGKTFRQDRSEGAAEKFYDAIKKLAG